MQKSGRKVSFINSLQEQNLEFCKYRRKKFHKTDQNNRPEAIFSYTDVINFHRLFIYLLLEILPNMQVHISFFGLVARIVHPLFVEIVGILVLSDYHQSRSFPEKLVDLDQSLFCLCFCHAKANKGNIRGKPLQSPPLLRIVCFASTHTFAK